MAAIDHIPWKDVFFYWPDYREYRAQGLAPRSALARAKINWRKATKALQQGEPTPERPWWWAESFSNPVAMFESREEARAAGNTAVKRGRTFYTGVYVMRFGKYRGDGFTRVEAHISTGAKT